MRFSVFCFQNKLKIAQTFFEKPTHLLHLPPRTATFAIFFAMLQTLFVNQNFADLKVRAT